MRYGLLTNRGRETPAMSNSLQSLGSNLLAAHLTSAIRHVWFDDIPAGETTADSIVRFIAPHAQ